MGKVQPMSDLVQPEQASPKDLRILRSSLLKDLARFAAEKKKEPDADASDGQAGGRIGREHWWSLRDAPPETRGKKELVLEAVQKDWRALQYASHALKADKEVVQAAVRHAGKAILFASDSLKADKEVVLECVQQDGNCLRFASNELRADKECVLVAVSNRSEALKFALEGLHQDRDCLIAAGLWDEGYDAPHPLATEANGTDKSHTKKVVLSTKFSLHEDSTPTATQFTVLLKAHPYFHQGTSRAPSSSLDNATQNKFVVYSPNAFQKGTCDPEWTRMEWPCRGTPATCRMPPSNQPICWRVSFRRHLEEARDTMGFMVQIVELCQQGTHTSYEYHHQLGMGQEIERVMAREVGAKVFVVYQSMHQSFRHRLEFEEGDIDRLSQFIQEWYAGGCSDREVCHVGTQISGT